MTPKSWTAKAAELRRTDREAAQHTAGMGQQTRRRRRRSVLTATLFTTVAVAVFVTAGVQMTNSTRPLVICLFAGSALVLVANVYLHRWLTRRIGTLTAIAVMSIGNGLLAASLTALPGQCPDAPTGRCSPAEIATWGMNGMLTPVVLAVMLGLPVIAGKAGFNISRYATRRWRTNDSVHPESGGAPTTRNILERMRPASKRIGAPSRNHRTNGPA